MMDNLDSVVLCWLQGFKALLPVLQFVCRMGVYMDFVVSTVRRELMCSPVESPLAASPHSHFANGSGFQSVCAAVANPG